MHLQWEATLSNTFCLPCQWGSFKIQRISPFSEGATVQEGNILIFVLKQAVNVLNGAQQILHCPTKQATTLLVPVAIIKP